MSEPILDQQTLDNTYLSQVAILYLIEAIGDIPNIALEIPMSQQAEGELINLRNALYNLLERFDPPKPENFDLIGG